jgi:hypothetical protein
MAPPLLYAIRRERTLPGNRGQVAPFPRRAASHQTPSRSSLNRLSVVILQRREIKEVLVPQRLLATAVVMTP